MQQVRGTVHVHFLVTEVVHCFRNWCDVHATNMQHTMQSVQIEAGVLHLTAFRLAILQAFLHYVGGKLVLTQLHKLPLQICHYLHPALHAYTVAQAPLTTP